MPPSGYTPPIADHKADALVGCYELMRAGVASGKYSSLEAAVAHELKTLNAALEHKQFEGRDLEEADLRQMLAYYRNLKASVDSGEYASYDEAMERQPEKLRAMLYRIHVGDDGNVTQQ